MQAAVRAKQAGIHMIVLGVGGWTDESELWAIASFPQTRNYIRVRNYADLRNFGERLVDYICNSRSPLPGLKGPFTPSVSVN